MAKAEKIASHLSYCAGVGWIGDGSSSSSTCPFKHSMHVEAVRYICSHCATNTKPNQILADSKGIHKQNMHDDVSYIPKPPPVPKPIILDENGHVVKRGRGRPKGSKNATNDTGYASNVTPATGEAAKGVEVAGTWVKGEDGQDVFVPKKRGRGRPKGSKNKR